jgi:hypothetical protein
VALEEMNGVFNSNLSLVPPRQFQHNSNSVKQLIPISSNNPIKTIENLEVEKNSP